MFVRGKNGELDELANPYLLSRSIGRHKPSAALSRMRAVATPEDRESDALLPPKRKPYYPSAPWTLDDLKARLIKEGFGEQAGLACAYAINSAIRSWLGDRRVLFSKRRHSTAVLYKGVLAAKLNGREYIQPAN